MKLRDLNQSQFVRTHEGIELRNFINRLNGPSCIRALNFIRVQFRGCPGLNGLDFDKLLQIFPITLDTDVEALMALKDAIRIALLPLNPHSVTGQSAIFEVMATGTLEDLAALIHIGANLNEVDNTLRMTPLEYACLMDFTGDKVGLLIDRGADVNFQTNRVLNGNAIYTPFITASDVGNARAMTLLYDAGAQDPRDIPGINLNRPVLIRAGVDFDAARAAANRNRMRT